MHSLLQWSMRSKRQEGKGQAHNDPIFAPSSVSAPQNHNSGKVHGAALGDGDVVYIKTQLVFHPDEIFIVPPRVHDFFAECKPCGADLESAWNEMFDEYSKAYSADQSDLKRRMEGRVSLTRKGRFAQTAAPTRKSRGIAVQSLVPKDKTFTAGSADLMSRILSDSRA